MSLHRRIVMKSNQNSGLSRRKFLQTGAAGAAVATAGMAMNLMSPTEAEAAPKKLPAKWDKTVDVLVIG